MKINHPLYLISTAILSSLILGTVACNSAKEKQSDADNTISISGAFALYPIAVKWGEEFKKNHPEVKFEISAGGAGKGITDALGGLVDLGAVSRDIYPEETSKGAFPIAVAKDAVIATVNATNPNLNEILAKGLTKEAFIKIFVNGTVKNWKDAGFSQSLPVHPYSRADAAGAGETWAKYLNVKQDNLTGTRVSGDPGVLQAVESDPDGIGYNNIAYVYNQQTRKQNEGVAVIPVDINSNGQIDADENFYGTLDQLTNAIATGKYPSPPARALYFVSKGKPQKQIVIDFLKWVLTDGQKLLAENGYVSLSPEQLGAEEKKLEQNANKIRLLKDTIAGKTMWAMTLLSILLAFAIAFGLYMRSAPLMRTRSIWHMLGSSEWQPLEGKFGFFPFIMGSLWVTGIALIVTLPLCLLSGIYLSEYADHRIKKVLVPFIDLLAGIPPVIFGVWGVLLIVPFIQKHFSAESTGYSVGTGGIVLAVMIFPLLINILLEVFGTIPKGMKEASLSLGATQWQTVKYVLLKRAVPGIIAATILAISRAFGETIAVMMVCGNTPVPPHSIFDGGYPLPALIANNFGEVMSVPLYDSALFFAALILFVIIFLFNAISRIILAKIQRKMNDQ